jgi:hypothetical protein
VRCTVAVAVVALGVVQADRRRLGLRPRGALPDSLGHAGPPWKNH